MKSKAVDRDPNKETTQQLYVVQDVPACMAGEEGFEPSHAGIKIQCLNQLGDSPKTCYVQYRKG